MLDDRKAQAVKYKAGMSKIDQYRRALEFCLFNAEKAPFDELRALWQTIGESYVFLAQLESRPRDTFPYGGIHGPQIAPEGVPFTDFPIDDRTRP
jgi:hypothetical protein